MKENRTNLAARGVILILLMGMLALFVSCGEPKESKTLEERMKTDESVQELISDLESDGSGYDISVEGNTLVNTYQYDSTYDFSDPAFREAAIEDLKNGLDTVDEEFTEIADRLEDTLGIQGIEIRLEYTDSNGDVIYSETF